MSWVWENFTKFGKEQAKCNKCGDVISRKNYGTGAMIKHLLTVHGVANIANKNLSGSFTSNQSSSASCVKETQPMIRSFIARTSLEYELARFAAKDGFSVAGITHSDGCKGFPCWTRL